MSEILGRQGPPLLLLAFGLLLLLLSMMPVRDLHIPHTRRIEVDTVETLTKTKRF